MPIAMTRDFMSRGMNSLDKFWVAFCNPAQDEEGSLSFVIIKDRQQLIGIGCDSAVDFVPIFPADPISKCGYLEVVLSTVNALIRVMK